ncbi:hypothetical protein KSF78_0003729 [Schistosoma japonicum]|nr:hypothetical protein KSF78_0003729 [Schistosoma japonicum]
MYIISQSTVKYKNNSEIYNYLLDIFKYAVKVSLNNFPEQDYLPSGRIPIKLQPNSKTFKLLNEQTEKGKDLNLFEDRSLNIV